MLRNRNEVLLNIHDFLGFGKGFSQSKTKRLATNVPIELVYGESDYAERVMLGNFNLAADRERDDRTGY